jgi:CO/xanthine dehydrogenase Mo-binding subunit
VPELTTRTEPPGAVVIEPGTIAPGRARGVPPLRREGPDKLTGAAKYADDLVFPAPGSGRRSGPRTHTFVHSDRVRSRRRVVTAADIPATTS